MTGRLSLRWPDERPFAARGGRAIRLLAASDEPDPVLEESVNRQVMEPIDLVLGCGDLAPDWLGFLADALRAPLIYVRGNHDRRGPWPHPPGIPSPSTGWDDRSLPGIPILALPWPGRDDEHARHDEGAGWRQVTRHSSMRLLRPVSGVLVISHVPPRGAGDSPADEYHVGFAAYRFVLRRVKPVLWLHGHTTRAAQRSWRVEHGATTLLNTTGSVLVQLTPPPGAGGEFEAAGPRSNGGGR